jgi:hypothetical protein
MRIFIILMISILSLPLWSQGVEIRDGDKAISFTFNGLELSSFEGGIGLKNWRSNSYAIFAIVNFKFYSSDNDIKGTDTAWETKESDIGLTIGLEFHRNYAKKVSPYIGISTESHFQHHL